MEHTLLEFSNLALISFLKKVSHFLKFQLFGGESNNCLAFFCSCCYFINVYSVELQTDDTSPGCGRIIHQTKHSLFFNFFLQIILFFFSPERQADMQDFFILTSLFLRQNFKNIFKENNWFFNTIITESSLLESSLFLSSQPRHDYYRWHSQTS